MMMTTELLKVIGRLLLGGAFAYAGRPVITLGLGGIQEGQFWSE